MLLENGFEINLAIANLIPAYCICNLKRLQFDSFPCRGTTNKPDASSMCLFISIVAGNDTSLGITGTKVTAASCGMNSDKC